MSYRIITAKELRGLDKEELIGLMELSMRILKKYHALTKEDIQRLLVIVDDILDVVKISFS